MFNCSSREHGPCLPLPVDLAVALALLPLDVDEPFGFSVCLEEE
jgi:hypothetical protein